VKRWERARPFTPIAEVMIIDRVRGVLVLAMQEPAVAERLVGEGAVPETSTPEELAQLIRVEIKRWAKAVQMSGAKLD